MAKVELIRQRALQARDAIELLSDKWRVAVLHVLTPGPLRANELQRALHMISPKMLTQTLRGLERDGLIGRKVHGAVPPHVEYNLTDMGASVILLRSLCHWAKRHSRQRDESRSRFDTSKNATGKSKSGA